MTTAQKPSLAVWAEAHPFVTAMVLGVVSSALASVILHAWWHRDEKRGLAGCPARGGKSKRR